MRDAPRTVIYYEAPHRIIETLEDVVAVMGGSRHVVIAREVTKLHEEFLRGRADEILEQLRARGDVKGEITLLIGRATDAGEKKSTLRTGTKIRQRLKQVMDEHKLDEKAALKVVAKEMGVSRSEAYRELQRAKRQ